MRKLTLILGLLALTSCMKMSEKETDESAGLNGGFEVAKNGLPVNWLMYTPNTVPDGEFEIIIDKKVFKEGKQSLRFDVINCSSTGGLHSPGFTNEFSEIGKFEGEGTYKLGFWIKNEGTGEAAQTITKSAEKIWIQCKFCGCFRRGRSG